MILFSLIDDALKWSICAQWINCFALFWGVDKEDCIRCI